MALLNSAAASVDRHGPRRGLVGGRDVGAPSSAVVKLEQQKELIRRMALERKRYEGTIEAGDKTEYIRQRIKQQGRV